MRVCGANRRSTASLAILVRWRLDSPSKMGTSARTSTHSLPIVFTAMGSSRLACGPPSVPGGRGPRVGGLAHRLAVLPVEQVEPLGIDAEADEIAFGEAGPALDPGGDLSPI